jgi:aminoglycoside 2''-phosphotransferase
LPEIPQQLQQRVRRLVPDLEIRQFDVCVEGLVNGVVIVNRQYVFRFAKTAEGAADLRGEVRVLDLIKSRVSLPIPEPFLRDDDCVAYPFLDGEPLLLETIRAMPESARSRVAEQLGRFLFELHSIDISASERKLPATLAPVTRDRWLKIYAGIKETVYPLLWRHQVQWAEKLFSDMLRQEDFFEYRPALIHGDLRPYHILIDHAKGELTGVIDFGVAGIGDPASDFGTLINTYGESFVVKMKGAYPHLDDLLPRARFYAQALELHWAWLGIELKENFWFIAHLGCARDIGT